jgi:uncharacterized phiE125 gp8 family phage protein
MTVSLVTITPPASEPVTLAEAMLHLRVDPPASGPHPEAALIETLIAAARAHVETETNRVLITQTLEARWDAWRDVLDLPRSPVQSVTSVTYVDEAGATQTLAGSAYRADVAGMVARVTPAFDTAWPAARAVTGAVAVRFVAGYGVASAVPAPLKASMLLLIGHLYENRTAATERALTEAPLAVSSLLAGYRVPWL